MDRFEWLSLWVFLALWWIVDFLFYSSEWICPKKYSSLKTCVIPKPPSWVFVVVWNMLYPLVAVSLWLYLNWNTDDTRIFDAVLALSLANYALNKLWYPLFFKWDMMWTAALDAALLTATAISVLVLMWVDTRTNGDTSYAAASLYIPYVLWLIYALLLNIDIAYTTETKDHVLWVYVPKDKYNTVMTQYTSSKTVSVNSMTPKTISKDKTISGTNPFSSSSAMNDPSYSRSRKFTSGV